MHYPASREWVWINEMTWPARLQTPPSRLQSIQIDAYIPRKELFKAESKYWNEIIARYGRVLHWTKIRLRNVMDMRAALEGIIIISCSTLPL
ncbi:hypothetical protein I3760_02G186500 [Carya illinoinensis]|uniref:Methyltransferase n=1 Tax=Carya illinoinensis TaxID=32201 RepID=A0A922K121_CARIL|nr:hypothetical protein I3760_02G186500 [Carya illinoinensis]KAG6728663.1 hypothetical protein I3842_02G183900 [Carya illinoinensis]